MKIRQPENLKNLELPFEVHISFEKIYLMLKDYAHLKNEAHPYHKFAKVMSEKIEKHPELISGFSDFSLLKKHEKIINALLDIIFPEMTSDNEIKLAMIPFLFVSFKSTNRFKKILKNAGDNYELNARGYEDDLSYINACTIILATVYNYPIDLKRPFFFDIPDNKLGIIKNYRALFNADFITIEAKENTPKVTEQEIKILLDNYDNIDLWKKTIPIGSYIFKGFGIMNLFDVTSDETISAIRTNLLRKDDGKLTEKIQENLRSYFNIKDLKVGFSIFDTSNLETAHLKIKRSESVLLEKDRLISCDSFFCDAIFNTVFKKNKSIAISNVEQYGEHNENTFHKRLKEKNIGSVLLIPIKSSSKKEIALLEIASPKAYDLNSVNEQKLKDIIPVFEASVERYSEEYANLLEATIQEHYTTLHPAVKWRFYDSAEKYHTAIFNKNKNPKLDEIVFKDVFPLFGQTDIKSSSIARNKAIKEDLTTQLSLAKTVLKEASIAEEIPIYNELMFRITSYLSKVKTIY